MSTKLLFNSTRAFIFCFACAFHWHASGQVLQPKRYEIPLTEEEEGFDVIPANDQGLYLSRLFFFVNKEQKNQIQLIRLDTTFQLVWNGFLPVERDYYLMGRKAFQNKLYLLFRYKDFTINNFILLIADADNGHYISYNVRGFIPFSQTEFQVTKEAVLIGGYFNRVPIVLHFSLKNYTSKILPGLLNESGELTQVRTYEDGSFDVLISAFNFMRQRTIWIKNYDADGTLLRNFALDAEENKHLLFGRSIKTSKDVQLVAGVYGTRSAEYARGIFIASIDVSGFQQIRYYNFGDLENFFKYMTARRQKRVKERIERRKIKGKKIKFNYRFLVHEIVPYQNQFVLLGEAFYPKYRADQGNSALFGTFYRPGTIVQNGRVFDGYFYTHAVVIGFNPNGKILWDNSFEINDAHTFTLEQFVKLEKHHDHLALLYLYDNALRTKIIKNNDVVEGKTIDPIRTMNENDVVKKSYRNTSKLEYWYDNYLFAYGVQEIENQLLGKSKRRVFYINKVKQLE
jgi:hypothetical protein